MTEERYAVSRTDTFIGYGCLLGLAVVALTPLLALMPFFPDATDRWLGIGLVLSATTWAATRRPKTLLARAIHPLSASWAVSLAILLPLLAIARFDEPRQGENGELLLSAYERSIIEIANVLIRARLSWGWTLVVLSVLMLIVIYVPHARPVSTFLTATRYSGRVLGVVSILTSFTFFAGAAAPGQGVIVLRHAQAVFDSGLAREGEAWRQALVARSVSSALTTPELAAKASIWIGQIAEVIQNEEVQRELIQHVTETIPGRKVRVSSREGLALDTAAVTLTAQRQEIANLQQEKQELAKGIAEILTKAASQPGVEFIGVVTRIVETLAADQSIAAAITSGLAITLNKEALKDIVRPYAEHVVDKLRSPLAIPPAEAGTAIRAAADSLQKSHAKAASLYVSQAEALAEEAEREMKRGNTVSASDNAGGVLRACRQAEYHSALALDIPNVFLDKFGVVHGLPLSTVQYPKLREVRSAADGVRERIAELHVKGRIKEVRKTAR